MKTRGIAYRQLHEKCEYIRVSRLNSIYSCKFEFRVEIKIHESDIDRGKRSKEIPIPSVETKEEDKQRRDKYENSLFMLVLPPKSRESRSFVRDLLQIPLV